MRKKIVGMLTTATLLTMALAGNVQAAEIRSVGPDGEAAVDASTIELTDDQIAQIKEGGYTAAICLHYGGNDWSTSQQKGLEDTFGELGIEIVAVTDANFSAETQVSNIETVMAKKPDILVSIPTDATATADAYKQAAAAGIKIIFMDQRANGLEAGKDYVSVVSADNYGNGYASGTVLGDALGGKGKVAMVYYDANFAPTNQRDEGFRDAMKNYPDIEIVTEQGFTDESGCAEQGDAILTQFPNIDGIYMLRFLVGDFKKVNARTATYIPERPVQSGLTDSLGNARLNKDTPRKAVDVDDQCMFMIECENGAFGSIEATRNAWGRNNYITFEIHGTLGSLYFNYERRDELQVCFASDPDDRRGFRTIYTGPNHPYGNGLWPIPALGIGYTETKIVECYDFFNAITNDTQASPNFEDGYEIELISDAILKSAQTHTWVDVH